MNNLLSLFQVWVDLGVFIVVPCILLFLLLIYGYIIIRKVPKKELELEQENTFPSVTSFFPSPWKHIEKQVLCALQAPREIFVLQLAKDVLNYRIRDKISSSNPVTV